MKLRRRGRALSLSYELHDLERAVGAAAALLEPYEESGTHSEAAGRASTPAPEPSACTCLLPPGRSATSWCRPGSGSKESARLDTEGSSECGNHDDGRICLASLNPLHGRQVEPRVFCQHLLSELKPPTRPENVRAHGLKERAVPGQRHPRLVPVAGLKY